MVTAPGSASQRPPASRMKLSRSIRRVTVGSSGGSGSRSPRPASLIVNANGSLPSMSRTSVVPAGAPTFLPSTKPRLSARYSAVCLAGGVSMPPGRPTARRTSCSCIQMSSGRLRSRVRQFHGTPPKIGDGSAAASVGGSLEQGVCRAVAAARISLRIASGLASRRLTTPISV